jgi:hypothetical protein
MPTSASNNFCSLYVAITDYYCHCIHSRTSPRVNFNCPRKVSFLSKVPSLHWRLVRIAIWMMFEDVTVTAWHAGADLGLVGPEAYTIFGALFKKKNTKLGTKVNIYLEWDMAINHKLKKVTNTTNIAKYRKIT